MSDVPFSFQAVLDGHWEFYHDDDCGAILDPETKRCSVCGWAPDLQSQGARRVKRGTPMINEVPKNEKHPFWQVAEKPVSQRLPENKALTAAILLMSTRGDIFLKNKGRRRRAVLRAHDGRNLRCASRDA